ncbi:MAG: Type IV secretory pathway VirB4 components-like protein [Parcubacteria group bacterium Gr01-1014_38]|nr:MAG: Type IV secretory pathway VirB4 components-like protein [Parcubacteria group bacterium Gr01-1014_38]
MRGNAMALFGRKKTTETPQGRELKREIATAEKQFREGVTTLRDLLAPAALRITPRHLELSGEYIGTLFAFTYPRYLASPWLAPLINLDTELDIALFVYPLESAVILKNLKKKVAQVQASIAMAQEKGQARDPLLETAYQDIEELRDRLTQGTERFFRLGLYFTIHGREKKELDDTIGRIESLLEGKLIYVKPAIYQMEQGFISTLPLGHDVLQVGTNMNTAPLSTAFPFVSSDLTSDTGILYGINRHNNSLIIFDRFSLENANTVIFAKSGAGKSYTVKLEILRSMMFGTEVIVIDPENEYRYLAQATGGTFLRISTASEHRINPFDLPPLREDDNPEDVLREQVTHLTGLIAIMADGLSAEEKSIADEAIWQTYALKDITPATKEWNREPPTLEDFYNILKDMAGGRNLALRLQQFVTGTYAGVFNKPTNIDTTTQLVVFNLRDMEEQLRPMAMYVVLAYIWKKIRASLKKRVLVIDEAWVLMQHEESAQFLFGIAKRARKYYLGVTTITQDVTDFLTSRYGKPIVTNSSIQFLLRQSPAAIDLIADTFYLTEGEKYLLLESDVGEGLFFAGLKHVAIKVVASYAEDQIITSDPRQVLEIEAARKEMETREVAPPAPSEPG